MKIIICIIHSKIFGQYNNINEKKGVFYMKKTAMLFLIAVLMMTNVSISRADTGPIQVNGLINIGEGYEDEDFELTTTIYNNGAGYRSVTIEVQDNDIGLSVDKTSLRIPGNRGIDITITGRFPKVNNDITASLKIVDDLNYTNDQEIRFYASKVNKKKIQMIRRTRQSLKTRVRKPDFHRLPMLR